MLYPPKPAIDCPACGGRLVEQMAGTMQFPDGGYLCDGCGSLFEKPGRNDEKPLPAYIDWGRIIFVLRNALKTAGYPGPITITVKNDDRADTERIQIDHDSFRTIINGRLINVSPFSFVTEVSKKPWAPIRKTALLEPDAFAQHIAQTIRREFRG